MGALALVCLSNNCAHWNKLNLMALVFLTLHPLMCLGSKVACTQSSYHDLFEGSTKICVLWPSQDLKAAPNRVLRDFIIAGSFCFPRRLAFGEQVVFCFAPWILIRLRPPTGYLAGYFHESQRS